MVLTAAQKQQRYRDNLKKKGLYDLAKAKHAVRMKVYRKKLTGSERLKYLLNHAESQKRYTTEKFKYRVSLPKRSQKIHYQNLYVTFSKPTATIQTVAKATKKVKQALPKDPIKKKLVVQAIAQSFGILPTPSCQRATRTFPMNDKKSILDFYLRDDISYQMPGKRDTVVVKANGMKEVYQKRILLYNLREVHQMFLHDNSNVDVSRSMFAQLRPPHVMIKAAMPHRVCVCLYHQNVTLLIDALSKHINGSSCSDLQAFTKSLVCDDTYEQCMLSACGHCSNNFQLNVENKVIDESVYLKWFQWKNTRGRAEKIEEQGTVKECVQVLSTKIKQYLEHVFIKRKQSTYFEQTKDNSNDESIIVHVDYAENFSIEEQDAIQAAHWSNQSISIFTAHVWAGPLKFSFALPSDNVTHDKYCVNTCLEFIINELKQYLPDLKTITFFSDGAASQFKQRFLFRNLTKLSNDYDINLLWSFFSTSHDKGVVDGIGGIVKRLVYQEIMTGKQCKSAGDFVLLAKAKTNTIILHEINQAAIDTSEEKLRQIFNETRSVRDTQKLHHLTVIDEDVIQCRRYAQSTHSWTVSF